MKGRVQVSPPTFPTIASTVFGHLPLVLVTGAGAEARNSIGIIIVTGMTIGSVFTLFAVPSLYVLFAKDHAVRLIEIGWPVEVGEEVVAEVPGG